MKYTHVKSSGNCKPHKLRPPTPYVGAKRRNIGAIVPHLPSNITEMVSTCFGMGSLELWLADRGVRIWGYDFEPLVANFWHYTLRDPSRVKHAVRQYYPIDSKSKYIKLKQQMIYMPNCLNRAALFFAIIRSSYAGRLSSGYSNDAKSERFNRRSWHQLDPIWSVRSNLSVEFADFQTTLAKHSEDIFTYLDPPYLMDLQEDYGIDGSLHRDFDHKLLASILSKRKNWIMSNADNDAVRNLYAGYEIITLDVLYAGGDKGTKKASELLIFSPDLHPNYAHLAAKGQPLAFLPLKARQSFANDEQEND